MIILFRKAIFKIVLVLYYILCNIKNRKENLFAFLYLELLEDKYFYSSTYSIHNIYTKYNITPQVEDLQASPQRISSNIVHVHQATAPKFGMTKNKYRI